MANVTKAVYQRLLAVFTGGELSDYLGGPAVFSGDFAPANAVPPFVLVRDPVADEPRDTKTTTGREVLQDILVVDTDAGSSARVRRLAEIVRGALHRAPLTLEGGVVILQSVSGPVVGPTEDGVFTRIVSLRIVLEEG